MLFIVTGLCTNQQVHGGTPERAPASMFAGLSSALLSPQSRSLLLRDRKGFKKKNPSRTTLCFHAHTNWW